MGEFSLAGVLRKLTLSRLVELADPANHESRIVWHDAWDDMIVERERMAGP